MLDCPTRGASFDTRRGLGVHHGAAHGELLANRECAHCGTPFHSVHEKRYGSEGCREISGSFSDQEYPNWEGGTDPDYGPGWRRVRKRALEHDGHRCVVCGASWEELGRNPDVHHVVPVRAFVETPVTTVRDAHYLANVVSLCVACHCRAEFGHVPREQLEQAV